MSKETVLHPQVKAAFAKHGIVFAARTCGLMTTTTVSLDTLTTIVNEIMSETPDAVNPEPK